MSNIRSGSGPWVRCKCGCGTKMRKFNRQGRRRTYVQGHNPKRRR